jgi:hypothetical protein
MNSSNVPKPAGHHDHRLRQVAEPELAHEEVMELERQPARDVRVVLLLERQRDVEADVLALRFGGAAVGGLHDSRTAARAHDEAPIGASRLFDHSVKRCASSRVSS